MSELISTGKKDASATQTQLDGLVVNIELTLISIIQGVAFSFLAEQSREVIIGLQLVFWPYAVTGLLIILLFWSRSLIHTLTVIRSFALPHPIDSRASNRCVARHQQSAGASR